MSSQNMSPPPCDVTLRIDALKVAKRKKAQVYCHFDSLIYLTFPNVGTLVTPLSTTDDTLAEPCTRCATFRPCSSMPLFTCVMRTRNQKRIWPTSWTHSFSCFFVLISSCRERKENEVFTKLARLVPGLVDLLTKQSLSDNLQLGDLVRSCRSF